MFITKAKHQRIVSGMRTRIDFLDRAVGERHQTIMAMAEGIADRQGALEHTQRQLNEALVTIETLREDLFVIQLEIPVRDPRGRFAKRVTA